MALGPVGRSGDTAALDCTAAGAAFPWRRLRRCRDDVEHRPAKASAFAEVVFGMAYRCGFRQYYKDCRHPNYAMCKFRIANIIPEAVYVVKIVPIFFDLKFKAVRQFSCTPGRLAMSGFELRTVVFVFAAAWSVPAVLAQGLRCRM